MKNMIALPKLSLAALLLFSSFGYAQVASRSQSLELNCLYVSPIQMKYLEKHVNYSNLDKNLESRVADQYIKRLDGSMLYLTEMDAKVIRTRLTSIFEKIKNKNCTDLDEVQKLYVKKFTERVEYAKSYLGPKFVFDPKTEIILDPDFRKRPKTTEDANKFHEKYMQYQIATYLLTDMKIDEAKQQVVRNYERALKRIQDSKPQEVLSNYLDSFARALDPHSSYLSKDSLEDFEIQMRLSLEGIGATLSSQDGFTVIEQLVPGGAAASSGKLKIKDKIIAVGQGESGDYQNVIEMDLRDVVRLIRGKKGSLVRLRILRKGEKDTERFEVSLIRDKIKLEDDAASITYLDREVNGVKRKIGLLNLPSFYADNNKNGPSSGADLKKLIAEANANKADALVLDVSTNGGGSLRDAVEIAGLFFATGSVVKQSQKMSAGSNTITYEVLADTDPTVDWAGPLVVLTSRVSASASEIVSGALQDYGRAVIVGSDHTFGKGSVQSVEYLPPGLGAIKTTVGMFFTAGGNSTQHRGVDSDILLPSTFATDDIGEKTLDYSLPPKQIKEFTSKTAFITSGPGQWKPVSKDVIKKLKNKSTARVAASEDFKKVKEEIVKNKERGKKIVLANLLKEKEQEKEKDKSKNKEKDKVKSEDPEEDYTLSREERKKKYLERADVVEAVNVAADLLGELGGQEMTLGAKDKKVAPPAPPANTQESTTN